MSLLPAPLTSEAFDPFGDVVISSSAHRGRRFFESFWIASPSAKLRCWISTFSLTPESELVIGKLEAHPHSAQAFVALHACRFVVMVAETSAVGQLPDPMSCRAFIADGPMGVIYRPGVWHASMMVLDTPTSFFVAQGLAADGSNDIIAPLATPIAITGIGARRTSNSP